MNDSLKAARSVLAASLISLIFLFNAAAADDAIVDLSVQQMLGFEEVPMIRVKIEVNAARDLHVAFQSWGDWKAVKRTMRRIPKSGDYHFEVPFDNLRPGKYRIAAYLTPRRKDWNDRVTDATHVPMEVLDQPTFAVQTNFGDEDKILQVKWPKAIGGSEEATLDIRYSITEPRDLIVRLANSDNWNQVGEMIFKVEEPGNTTVPLANLRSDFPAGNYAWIVFLAESGTKEPQLGKLGKHFVLTAE